MAKKYRHIAIDESLKKEFENIKVALNQKGFFRITDDEVMKILLKKHRNFSLSIDDMDDIFKVKRGHDEINKY